MSERLLPRFLSHLLSRARPRWCARLPVAHYIRTQWPILARGLTRRLPGSRLDARKINCWTTAGWRSPAVEPVGRFVGIAAEPTLE